MKQDTKDTLIAIAIILLALAGDSIYQALTDLYLNLF